MSSPSEIQEKNPEIQEMLAANIISVKTILPILKVVYSWGQIIFS